MENRKANENNCCPPEDNRPDLRSIEGPEADEELAQMLKALAHPARVQIVRILTRRDSCICGEIVDVLPLAQSTVSQHLKVLKEAGIIRVASGRWSRDCNRDTHRKNTMKRSCVQTCVSRNGPVHCGGLM
jgi:DNA-binding transcriptional ArsR family regulator